LFYFVKPYQGCTSRRLKPKLSSPIDLESVKNSPTISRLIISNPIDIKTKIIPLFDNYPLRTTKLLDYEDWKKLIEMKAQKYHLSEEKEMKGIKSNMNTSRKI
jgi:hypothetical protein